MFKHSNWGYETTVKEKLVFEGIGIHSGESSIIEICPALEGEGIYFERTDLTNKSTNPFVKINSQNIKCGKYSSIINNDEGVRVRTVEHLLAAIYDVGLSNLHIKISSEEIPILDGSALRFYNALKNTEVIYYKKAKKFIKILKKVEYREDDSIVSIKPSDRLIVDAVVDYDSAIGKQEYIYDSLHTSFEDDIAPSKTYGKRSDYKTLLRNGFARGATLDNTIVVTHDDIENRNKMKYHDEFVRHKILDVIGDLMLMGHEVIGYYTTIKGGHKLNHKLIQKLFNDKESLEYVTYKDIPAREVAE